MSSGQIYKFQLPGRSDVLPKKEHTKKTQVLLLRRAHKKLEEFHRQLKTQIAQILLIFLNIVRMIPSLIQSMFFSIYSCCYSGVANGLDQINMSLAYFAIDCGKSGLGIVCAHWKSSTYENSYLFWRV